MTVEQLIPWLVGIAGVPLVNAIKKAAQLEGKQAVLLAAFVSFLLAVIALFAAGQLTGAAFELEALPATFAAVLAASQLAYKLLDYRLLG